MDSGTTVIVDQAKVIAVKHEGMELSELRVEYPDGVVMKAQGPVEVIIPDGHPILERKKTR